jgi:hypothetical protein
MEVSIAARIVGFFANFLSKLAGYLIVMRLTFP